MNDDDDSYLKRLPPEYYRGQACVHWSLTIQDRKQGWLKPVTLYRFRKPQKVPGTVYLSVGLVTV